MLLGTLVVSGDSNLSSCQRVVLDGLISRGANDGVELVVPSSLRIIIRDRSLNCTGWYTMGAFVA
jgi:hypothetical protein